MPLTRRQLLATLAAAPVGHAATRPNVVFMITDDHGAWAMGPWGCQDIHTPNLAKLAAGGARFTNAFAATPVCSPSRMTYLTGKLPSGHGVQDFLLTKDAEPGSPRFLQGQTTCSELLAKNGYTTGVCGKWHMGDDGSPQAGFTYWRTTTGGGGPYRNPEFWVDGQQKKIEGFKTDITTDFALEFIEQNRSRPFFLFIPFHAPHTPFDFQPDRDRSLYADSKFPCFPEGPRHPQRRWGFEKMHANRETKTSYSALVSGVDHSVGRIVTKLEELGLRENTVVIFSADQGWNAGHHGAWGKGNATIPFNMYEESIRVPLIWNHPGQIAPRQVLDPLVSTYDFFPTLLEYVGITAPPDRKRVGRSYAPILRGERPEWRDELYFEYCYVRAVRTQTLKYIERSDDWPSELFDMEVDPSETVNLIGDRHHPKQVAELRSRLKKFFDGVGAPPLAQWRKTTRQSIPIDSGYYDGWEKRGAR